MPLKNIFIFWFFILIWLAISFYLVDYYKLDAISEADVRILASSENVYKLEDSESQKILSKLIDYFEERKIISNFLSYNVLLFHNYQLAIEATNPKLTYRDAILSINLNENVKNISRYETGVWEKLKKDEIFEIFKKISVYPKDDFPEIKVGPGQSLIFYLVGGFLFIPNLDNDSKIFIIFLSLLFSFLILGFFKNLIGFICNGFKWFTY